MASDLEQLQKKIDWLDAGRREDKAIIAGFEESMAALQQTMQGLAKRITELEDELAQTAPKTDLIAGLEEKINGVQIRANREIEKMGDQIQESYARLDSQWQGTILKIKQSIQDQQEEFEVIPQLEEQLEARKEEEYRLRHMIAEVDEKINQAKRDDGSWVRTINLVEEGRRKDSKRIIEMQTEVDAARKRTEQQSGKIEMLLENLRKLEVRLGEMYNNEGQRNQEQRNFFEKQSLQMVNQEREWKEVQSKFQGLIGKFEKYEKQMAEVTVVSQSLATSQETFEDNSERIEKRIHEITELHRINREQMLSDWATFQSEIETRLAQFMQQEEERRKDYLRKINQLHDVVTENSEQAQTIRDAQQQLAQRFNRYLTQWLDFSKDFLSSE
jgi:chromosome segregation ATPase